MIGTVQFKADLAASLSTHHSLLSVRMWHYPKAIRSLTTKGGSKPLAGNLSSQKACVNWSHSCSLFYDQTIVQKSRSCYLPFLYGLWINDTLPDVCHLLTWHILSQKKILFKMRNYGLLVYLTHLLITTNCALSQMYFLHKHHQTTPSSFLTPWSLVSHRRPPTRPWQFPDMK